MARQQENGFARFLARHPGLKVNGKILEANNEFTITKEMVLNDKTRCFPEEVSLDSCVFQSFTARCPIRNWQKMRHQNAMQGTTLNRYL